MVNILLRFDLVFCLLDTKNSEWDRVVSSYILRGKSPAQELATTSRPDTWSFSMLQVSCECFFSVLWIQIRIHIRIHIGNADHDSGARK
jgi:hypothetical protein